MKLRQLATIPNLRLAWRRITTGGNQQYKRLYRDLYYAYEVALEPNLRDLQARILGGTFSPREPERIYLPKPSGLHRPLGLLHLEDQIVLQAFANLAAKKIHSRRRELQLSVVFSNVLQRTDSIFFFQDWRTTYNSFQSRVSDHFDAGLRWVGDFDLAAFYDTISHDLLLRTLYPRTKSSDLDWIEGCLQTWSSEKSASGHGHGLPQGPIASDFLAEAFLLPIDLALKDRSGYTRYVDDVRLLGRTEDEVREQLIELERRCRERGLIPQAGKFAIKRARSADDALGMLPSMTDPQRDPGTGNLTAQQARRGLRASISGRPYRVTDKTRFRYVIFRADADNRILNTILRLLPRHPEHTDAFFVYLARFGYRKTIERASVQLLRNSPYGYVRGEAWHVLARYLGEKRGLNSTLARELEREAIAVLRRPGAQNLAEQWGACHFLCIAEMRSGKRLSRFVKNRTAILQALLAPVLPPKAFEPGDVVENFLRRTSPEPGLAISSRLLEQGTTLRTLGLKPTDLPSQVRNVLRELGAVSTKHHRVDAIAEILNKRYGAPTDTKWRGLLGADYAHALGLLRQAEATFNSGRSFWLICQNSFNQTVFLALQRHLKSTGHPGACTVVNRKGELEHFGVTLDPTGPFSRECPTIADCFRQLNNRRNALPVAHPYEKKTAVPATYLGKQERNRFVGLLRSAYQDAAALVP